MRARWVALALALFSSGCLPVVQHGPWVRQGVSGGPLIGAVWLDEGENTDPGLGGSADASLRVGLTTSDSAYTGVSVGAQLSLLFLVAGLSSGHIEDLPALGSLDVYATGPRIAGKATSFGAQFSQQHIMPYVQLGAAKPVKGWYTTQALLFAGDDDLFLYMPGITWFDSSKPGRAVHYTFTAGIGTESNENLILAMFTIGMEFFRRK